MKNDDASALSHTPQLADEQEGDADVDVFEQQAGEETDELDYGLDLGQGETR